MLLDFNSTHANWLEQKANAHVSSTSPIINFNVDRKHRLQAQNSSEESHCPRLYRPVAF